MAPYTFEHAAGTALTVAIGFFFGLVLERAGFGNARNLAAQFYLYDMRVLKVMFTAIVTAMILIFFAVLARPALAALDHWLVWSLLGAALGAAVSGALAGRLRPEIHRGPRVGVPLRLAMALIGGALMGYGSQWARGCTSGQALSGGAVLAVGSWAFMMSVFGGAYALAYFVRRLWT